MKDIKDLILLKEEFICHNSKMKLIQKIQKSDKRFLIKLSDSNNFKFYSKFSIGTLYIQGFPKILEGIKGFGQIEEIDEKSTKVILNTKIRIELYFVVFLFLIIIIAQTLSSSEIPKLTLILFPIILFWFWLVLRIQEKMLFKKLKKYISN